MSAEAAAAFTPEAGALLLNAQARLIKGRQAQLHSDQQAWKRNMRAS